jgi:hypothetical protein
MNVGYSTSGGKTLHMACHVGKVELVQLLQDHHHHTNNNCHDTIDMNQLIGC